MARRKDSLLDDLALLPWWVSVTLSVVTYISLKHLIPYITFTNPIYKGMASALPAMATPFAILFLFPAFVSAFNAFRKKKLLERQQSANTISSLSWREFEEMVGEAYRRGGYRVVENHGGGPDGGIDLRLKRDGELTLVQCKRWKSSKVGVQVVRELYGVMRSEGADSGIVVCSGYYTEDAKAFARGKPIELVDLSGLLRLICTVQKRELESEPIERSRSAVEICPKCSSEMILRIAKKGPNIGQQFWGCSAFPKCRTVKPYVAPKESPEWSLL